MPHKSSSKLLSRLIFLVLVSASALGCHGSVGPVIGRSNGSTFVGWEASGGYAWVRGAVGQSYRRAPVEHRARPTDPKEVVTYAAAEPWLYVGGTLGAAWSTQSDLGIATGVWEGIAFPLQDACNEVGFLDRDLRPGASVAVGWRYLAGANEFYVSPKVGFLECVSLF